MKRQAQGGVRGLLGPAGGVRWGALGVLVALASACGDDTSTGSGASGTGGKNTGGAGSGAGTATGGAGPGGAGQGGAGQCVATGQACADPDACCSHFCIDGVCIEAGDCDASGTECTSSGQCCSGRCEPETGTGLVKCLAFCVPEGTACAKALDCCDLNCNGGVCGGAQCLIESEVCTTNAECCSNICTGGQCQIDLSNTDCRPTGETCNSGSGSGCCEACDETQNPPICIHGPATCHVNGAGCTTSADCCNGQCLPNDQGMLTCQIPCIAINDMCLFDAECCGLNCVNGSCQPPVGNCVPTGDTCTTNADCCSGLCVGGSCTLPCELDGAACAANGDCCGGQCVGEVCTTVM